MRVRQEISSFCSEVSISVPPFKLVQVLVSLRVGACERNYSRKAEITGR